MKQSLRLSLLIAAIIAAGAVVFGSALADMTRVNATGATGFDASAVYNSKCAKCHGRDGRSKTMRGRLAHSRDLTKADWQDEVSDERIYNSISNGKGKMPSFKKKLSENDINSLVTYVRRLRK